MRTTLAIDDDVLHVAKELAKLERKSIGEVISSLARKALRPVETGSATRNGIPLLHYASEKVCVSSELVKRLGEELL